MAKLNSGIFWEDKIPGSYWKVKAQVILWFLCIKQNSYIKFFDPIKIFKIYTQKVLLWSLVPFWNIPGFFKGFEFLIWEVLKRKGPHRMVEWFISKHVILRTLRWTTLMWTKWGWYDGDNGWLARGYHILASYLGLVIMVAAGGYHTLGLTSGRDRYQITEKAKAMVDYSSFFFKHFTFLSWENELFIFPCKKN